MGSAALPFALRRSWLGDLLALFRRPALPRPALPPRAEQAEDSEAFPVEFTAPRGRRRPMADLPIADPLSELPAAPTGPRPLPDPDLSGPQGTPQPTTLLLAPALLESCVLLALHDAAAAGRGDPGGAQRYNLRLRSLSQHLQRALEVS